MAFPVTGMHCAGCVRTVEKALLGVRGVVSANVNLAQGAATVAYRHAEAGPADLAAAVQAAGYTLIIRAGPTEVSAPTSANARELAETADEVHRAELADYRRRFWGSAALTLAIMILGLRHMLGGIITVPWH